jgi:hypothetical protein
MKSMICENNMKEDIVLILETKDNILANMVKEALENQDIPVLLKSPTGYYLRGMLPIDQGFFNMRLYVQKIFQDKAVEIVETIVPPEEIS